MAISRVNSRCEAFTIFLPLFHADFRLSAKIPLCRKSDLLTRGNGGFIERDFSPRISTWPVLLSRWPRKKKRRKKKENENFPRHRRRNTKRARTISVYIFLSQRRVICTQRPWKNITGNLSYFPLKFRFSPREMQAFLSPFHQCWHWSPRFLDKAKDNGPCRLTRRGRIEFFFCLIYPRSLI